MFVLIFKLFVCLGGGCDFGVVVCLLLIFHSIYSLLKGPGRKRDPRKMIKSAELCDQFCLKASAQLFDFLTIAVWPYYERICFIIRVDRTYRLTTTVTIDLKSERFYNFKNIGFGGAHSKRSTLFTVCLRIK